MSASIKANRKGRSLCNYSTAGLGFKGTSRRNTFIGTDCPQNRVNSQSLMRNLNYDGRVEVKKCTTLSRAIAQDEQRRRSDAPVFRARPGYIGDGADAAADASVERRSAAETPQEPAPKLGEAAAARCTWIDTRSTQVTHRSSLEEPRVEQQRVEPQNGEVQPRQSIQMPVKLSSRDLSQSQPLLSPQKAKLGSYSSEAQAKLGSHGSEAQVKLSSRVSQPQAALLSPAATRRSTSPTSNSDRPSSPRVPPGSDTGTPGSARGGNSSTMRFSSASTRSPRPGSSIQSADLETSRLSQMSLGASQFGTGERLDVKKWSFVGSSMPCMTERTPKKRPANLQAAHYEIVVEQLRKRRDQADGAEREELDKELAALLHERRSGSSPTSPRPMATAFTDRSLRKREGLGSRRALRSEDGTSTGAATPHSDCGCAVCKPNVVSPAGQMSHSIQTNLAHSVHVPSTEPPPAPQTVRQKSAPQGKRSPGSPNYNSNHITRIIKEPHGGVHVDCLDECPLTQQLGNRVKASGGAAGRSLSADVRMAGRYRRKMELDLENDPHMRWRAEGCIDTGARNEVAMVLSPREADPPRPTKITSCKKADGDSKFKVSQQAERVSVHWNQPLYRYECAAVRDLEGPDRSLSLPADQFLVFPRCGQGSPRRPEWAEGSAGDFTREGLGGARRSPRAPEGREVAQAVNHEHLAECAARHRAERLASDQRFSDLCAFTEESSRAQSREMRELKERYTAKEAKTMASALAWHE